MDQGEIETAQRQDVMRGLSASAPEFCLDVPRLLQQFEGLGDNCDFGMVQRAVGIEPLGLFRFAGCSAADMRSMLRRCFEPLGEPEDLWLDEVPLRREYWVKSRQYPSFSAHTTRYGGRDDPEVVRLAQIEATRFLKRKLLRDLSPARRLFVHRGEADISTIREIAAQLQTYCDNRLLWVQPSDAAHLPGSVECTSDGLLLGYVSHVGVYEPERVPCLPVDEWISVCVKAYRLWRKAEPAMAPLKDLISRNVAAQRCRWSAPPTAASRLLDGPAPGGGAMIEHQLKKSGPTVVYQIHVPVGLSGTYAFSVWILVPEGFRGRRIVASIAEASIISRWNADPKRRGRWQRIWVVANVPAEARSVSCVLTSEGEVGDVFYSASWCLERRNGPLGYGFVF